MLLPAVLLAATCGGGVSRGPSIPPGIQSAAPPPQEIRYTRINIAGDIQLPDTKVLEMWDGPHLHNDLLTYDVTTYDVSRGEPGDRLTSVRHFIGKQGYGYLGTTDPAGELSLWEPPQVLLPANPRVGNTWKASHRKGQSVSERSCEILDSDYCTGGIVVVCDSRKDGGVIVLRDHFCSEDGWGGFEALVQTGKAPAVRMWSEDLYRNGKFIAPPPDPQAAPAAPPEQP